MKEAHISIDDCILNFKMMTEEKDNIDSIFDIPFFQDLRNFHETYHVKFTLYCWEHKSGYNFSRVTDAFQMEFAKNSSWLKVGFHGSAKFDYLKDENGGRTVEEFKDAYLNFKQNAIRCFTEESLARCLRLHRYIGCREEVEFLKKEGVNELLTAHDQRISYDLSEAENETVLLGDSQCFRGIKYSHSDICMDMFEDEREFQKIIKNNRITLFAHEKVFCSQKTKWQKLFELLLAEGYSYIN